MKQDFHLLIIDPQNDFCDLPPAYLPTDPANGRRQAPSLPVAGSHEDMRRLAALIGEGIQGLSQITVTLDSHHRYDIAHPTFWMRGDGEPVAPFTPITAVEVREGHYHPRDPAAAPRALAYLDALEAAGRYTLMVWPIHCEIGTWGHNLHADIHAACNRWEDLRLSVVHKVMKGSNPWTEHYSAIMAEVPDPEDPHTQLNRALIDRLARSDRVYIAGEAGSHCVKATTEHIAEHFGDHDMSRLVLIQDCMSAVTGFDAHQARFFDDMRSRGVRVAMSSDVLPEWLANADH